MKSLLPRRRRLYCSYESVVNTSRAGPCCRHFPPRARVSSAGRLATSMPSLAAHLGVREPRRTRGDASPRPPSSSSPGASVRLPSTEPTQDAEPASETRTPERSHPAPRAQTPGVVPRVISRRGSLVARRNSTLASVAERLAEESRELRDEAFDVPTLDVPDPPATHLPTFRGKPRERTYRQPDGTLSPTRPARNPYAVAARKDWADLVQYARLNDGDDECTRDGRSFRYGVGVTWPEHAAYMKKINLEPETLPDGEFVGYDEEKTNPLNDQAHPFHAYVREHDAATARRKRKEMRKAERAKEAGAEDADVAENVAEKREDDDSAFSRQSTDEDPLPPMPWLDEKQRAFVREAVLESRRRYNQRGGLEPIETHMTI